MADEVLATLVAVLAGAVLAAATLAGAYLLRRLHELSDRMIVVELAVQRFRVMEQDLLDEARAAARKGGKRRAQ